MDADLSSATDGETAVLKNTITKSLSHGSFMSCNDVIDEGDTVIIYVNFGTIYAVKVKRGITLHMKYGALRHEFLIGKRFGSRISATAGYVYALRPSADLWTRSLNRRTQILYTPDCSLILMLLDAKPGSIICESGTGSGSLSHALAMSIAPSGHLYTHDIEESRVEDMKQEFKDHGFEGMTTCLHRDVCLDGFAAEDLCDGVFLDLPAPWDVITYAKRALSKTRGGRIVSFSPCIEQVQRACEALRCQGFVQVETVELVPRKLKALELAKETLEELNASNVPFRRAKSDAAEETQELPPGAKKRKLDEETKERSAKVYGGMIAFPPDQPSHTGYLTSATLLPTAFA